ncbi:MAG TPA: cytochrome c [Gaiellaceae bacterium]|nr:cytochrome c [Gaiellaceae bacterium]
MKPVRLARSLTPAALIALVLFAAGCGGGGHKAAEAGESSGVDAAGAKVYDDAGCGDCHTLAAAESKGKVGPNLDQLQPNADRVKRQVTNGGGGMPSFKDKLSAKEIEDVANFVSTSAGIGAAKFTFEPDETKLDDCTSRGDECWPQAFGNIAYEDGPRKALDELERLSQTNQIVRATCHRIAHMIGAGGLRHFDGNVGNAFVEGTPTCGSGYYHGLLQWKLAGLEEDEVAPVAREACNDPKIRKNNFIYYQCVHGLGHGLMLYTGLELPIALRLCHSLQTEFDQTSCSGGVFMENLSSSFGLRTRWLKKNNLLYPCNIVSHQDKLYCYLLVSSRILPAVNWNWKKAADWCRRSEPGWVDVCFQSYGRDASGAAVHNADRTRYYCAQAGSGEKHCLYGAARDIMNNNSEDPAAAEMCSEVKQKFRSFCFWGMGTIIGTQHADEAGRRDACARFNLRRQDLENCVAGANAGGS